MHLWINFTDLWDKSFGRPPVLFNIMNNHYGMGGQTAGETMGFDMAARVGAGINPDQMHAERVDGYNPLAVADATLRKKDILLSGSTCFLDIVTYRMSGHSSSDASSYRSKEEMELWEKVDCVKSYANYLIKNGLLTNEHAEEIQKKTTLKIRHSLELAINTKISPYSNIELIESVMFSNQSIEKFDDREAEVLLAQEDNPRKKQLEKKNAMLLIMRENLFQLIEYIHIVMEYLKLCFIVSIKIQHLLLMEKKIVIGEELLLAIGLTESIPYHRLFNSPISRSGNCWNSLWICYEWWSCLC